MSTYTVRTQVLLTPEQRARLEQLAEVRGISVAAVMREAVDALVAPQQRSRTDAMASLFASEAPVDDWDVMKQEILTGATRDADA